MEVSLGILGLHTRFKFFFVDFSLDSLFQLVNTVVRSLENNNFHPTEEEIFVIESHVNLSLVLTKVGQILEAQVGSTNSSSLRFRSVDSSPDWDSRVFAQPCS